MPQNNTPEAPIALFKGKMIRKVLFNKEWWFSIVDVVAALTDTPNPRDYWYRTRTRLTNDEQIELSTICRQLKLISTDGKQYGTDCANTEGIFRIVQPSPPPKPNRSNDGWQRLAMSEFKKLKIRN